MGGYSDDARKYLRSNSIGRRPVYHRLQPFLVSLMVFRICPKGVDQDVDVRKDQSRPSMRSRREALSFKSTPGKVPPPTRHSGRATGGCSARFIGRRSTSSSPCSMREVRVVLRLAASRRARSRSASSSRTVVLMRQSILAVCLYVNLTMGCKGSRVQISALRSVRPGPFRTPHRRLSVVNRVVQNCSCDHGAWTSGQR